MALRLTYTVSVCEVPNGAGGMSVPSAQVKTFTQQQVVTVPGTEGAYTLGNFNTALTGSSSTPTAGSLAADINAQITVAVLAQLNAFSSGGG